MKCKICKKEINIESKRTALGTYYSIPSRCSNCGNPIYTYKVKKVLEDEERFPIFDTGGGRE